jgi:hypothetical protein
MDEGAALNTEEKSIGGVDLEKSRAKIDKMAPDEKGAYVNRLAETGDKIGQTQNAYMESVYQPGADRLQTIREQAVKVDAKVLELIEVPAPAAQADLTQKPVQPAQAVPGPT